MVLLKKGTDLQKAIMDYNSPFNKKGAIFKRIIWWVFTALFGIIVTPPMQRPS